MSENEQKGMIMKEKENFTLIELLVVIAIIAILAGILMPALSSALQKGKIIQCTSNQKFIALALNMYASDNKEFYPSAQWTGDQPWRYWWRAILMCGYLGKTFKSMDQTYDISKRGKTVLICPEDSDPASGGTGDAATDYRSYGLNGSITDSGTGYGVHYIPRHRFRPGTSCGKTNCNTGGTIQKGPQDIFLTADSRRGRVIWWGVTENSQLDETNPRSQIQPFHRVGVPISFVDGHIRFIRYPFAYQKLDFENILKF